MQNWSLNKKLRYLTERKEILYGIWNLEIGGYRYSKNFYRAFANEARLFLAYEHNQMPKLVEFQNSILDEVLQIRNNPQILQDYYTKHEKAITLIVYHKDEYIKQRVLDYKNMLKTLDTGSKIYGIMQSLQSEIRLLYQRGYVENWETFNEYAFDSFHKKINEKKQNQSPQTQFPQKASATKYEKANLYFAATRRVSERHFTKLANEKMPDDASKYRDEFNLLENKVCFWLSLYKSPEVIYFKDYKAFREAIDTEIDVCELSGTMPHDMYELSKKLVDFKFEKMEFIKNFLQYNEDLCVTNAKKYYQSYLANYSNEINRTTEGKVISPEFNQRIKDMYSLKARLLMPSKNYDSDGGNKYGRCN